ncbi:hypothetical protein [Parasphingorhabdus sp.]|uniref:hypothetical protein n=1 Tax=Parasphingorhabdus sp. TaxID=2709688 RepID=UPI003002C499
MLADIKTAIREKGIVVLTGEYVREADAAALIDLAPKTLANWRGGDGRLPYIKRNQRPVYALTDLADYLASA